MSNIFKSVNLSSPKPIKIRDLRPPVIDEDNVTKKMSMESILTERDQLMAAAYSEIENERSSIEAMRLSVIAEIEQQRVSWEEEKKTLQQQAYEDAFQEGYEEGRNKALSDMANTLAHANAITLQSQETAKAYQESQERVILELAITAATKIIGTTLEEDEEIYLSVIRRALKEVREMPEIKLYISQEYYHLVSQNRSELASIFPPNVPFLIFVNEEFNATDCFIETNHGRIVVSIDEQLNELREQLIEIQESGD